MKPVEHNGTRRVQWNQESTMEPGEHNGTRKPEEQVATMGMSSIKY